MFQFEKNSENINGSENSGAIRRSERLGHIEPTYAELRNALRMMSEATFLTAFGTLLNERKLILLSASISKLSESIDGLQAALLPFIWQHTVVTIVPASVVSVCDLCDAPTPYLIGVLKSPAFATLPHFDACEDTVIIDIDSRKVIRSVGDESTILPNGPLKALRVFLKDALKEEAETSVLLVREAFARLFVELVGHFKEHIRDGPEPFCKSEFVKNAGRKNVRMFLDWFCETTMFAEFADTVRMCDVSIGRSLFLRRCEQNEKLKGQNAKGKSINKTMKQFVAVASDKFKDWTTYQHLLSNQGIVLT